MTAAITNDGSDVISRKIIKTSVWHLDDSEILVVFECNRVANWITSNNYTRVGLQFPDELLRYSVKICSYLNDLTGDKCFVLADRSFAECCVDEVVGQRLQINALVHYGRACLTENVGRIPVLYIYGKFTTELDCNHELLHTYTQTLLKLLNIEGNPLLIVYDFRLKQLAEKLRYEIISVCDSEHLDLPSLIWTEPNDQSGQEYKCKSASEDTFSNPLFIRCGRLFFPSKSAVNCVDSVCMPPWSFLYIGPNNMEYSNLLPVYQLLVSIMEVDVNKALLFDPFSYKIEQISSGCKQLIKRRSYLIEKAKDAQQIGILIGTLSSKYYKDIVERLKRLLRKANRSYITLVVGQLNPAKLANFPELDILILVSCPETSLLDSRDFLLPIITPFEMECALRSIGIDLCSSDLQGDVRIWTGQKMWVDFKDLLPGGNAYVPEDSVIPPITESFGEMSLISGRVRLVCKSNDLHSSSSSSLVPREQLELANNGHWNSGRITRSWYGLDPKIGQTPVAKLKIGLTGLPTQYTRGSSPENFTSEITENDF